MKKILFILDDFYPIKGAPSVRINSFIKEIEGEIHVLGGFREFNYQKNMNYHSLKRPKEKNLFGFILFLIKLNYQAIKLSKEKKFDSIILSIPKYELLYSVSSLKKNTDNLILDIRDSINFINYESYFKHFFPQSLAKLFANIIKRNTRRSLNKSINIADKITVANQGIKNSLIDYQDKIKVISNGVNIDIFNPSTKKSKDIINLAYVGNFAEKDLFDFIYEVLPEYKDKIILNIIGGGRNKDKILSQITDKEICYIDHGFVEHSQLPKILDNIDIGFIFRENRVDESIPVVLYEYAAMNIPVISNNVGEMSNFIIENNTGFVIENSKDLKELFENIITNNQSLKKFNDLHSIAKEKFSRQIQAKKFSELINI